MLLRGAQRLGAHDIDLQLLASFGEVDVQQGPQFVALLGSVIIPAWSRRLTW